MMMQNPVKLNPGAAVPTAALVLMMCGSAWAGAPHATYPTASDTVYQTMPRFNWDDAVAYPFDGAYHVQIAEDSSFKHVVDQDTVPACIAHYSPTIELKAGQQYFWRVLYRDSNGNRKAVSASEHFEIKNPAYVVDVLKNDSYDDIKRKLAMARENAGKGAMLRFPVKHSFHLTQTLKDTRKRQEPGEGTLLNVTGARNLIIDGRGSKIILKAAALAQEDKATKRRKRGKKEVITLARDAGFFFARGSRHIQVKNFTLDYTTDSLMQYAGKITSIDRARGTITVKVNTEVYGNFEEMKHYKDIYFLDAENNQRIGSKGVSYPIEKSWAESARGDGMFDLKLTSWGRFEKELKVGCWAVTSHRGGDAFNNFNGCEDVVINNCRVEGCRGRYFIVKHVQPFIRCINNQFVRSGGRVMGAASGGVNNKGEKSWMENLVLEYTRDDAFHAGEVGDLDAATTQTVVRNLTIRGAFRNSLWMHSDRCWIEGNRIYNGGSKGLNLSGTGLDAEYDTIDVGIIRNNLIANCNRASFIVEGDVKNWNKHLTIENNIVCNNRMNQAYSIRFIQDSTFANNLVEATINDWRVYSEPGNHIGFDFEDSENVTGRDNRVSDDRLPSHSHLRITATCSDVDVSVAAPAAKR